MNSSTPPKDDVSTFDDDARRDESGRQRDQAAERRDSASDQRDLASERRDSAAVQRDLVSAQRDRLADRRDRAGDQRDLAAEERDRAAEQFEDSVGDEISTTTLRKLHHVRAEAATDRSGSADDRRHSAGERTSTGEDRSVASTDRSAGDSERRDAAADRTAALSDRDSSAAYREEANLDELTGAYRRGPGFLELEREMARAFRALEALSVAFVDVDHLKQVNDTLGHAAGDRLLQHVASALKSRLRSYDPVVRYGGDEFICVMPGLTAEAATERLATINSVLRTMSQSGSMSLGVAELQPGDSAHAIVGRADESLYRARGAKR